MMRDEFQEYMSRRAAHLDRQQRAIEQGYGNQRHPEETAFEAGYRAGALAMRERAAKAAESERLEDPANSADDIAYDLAINDVARAIRALPVEQP